MIYLSVIYIFMHPESCFKYSFMTQKQKYLYTLCKVYMIYLKNIFLFIKIYTFDILNTHVIMN